MDFTPVMEPGRYMIAAGEVFSRAFDIGDDVWESSVWKVLNFFLSQRCGYEVPGKHRACHRDLLLRHGDKAIVANGGWHDAADLAQGMENTAEGTAGLFLLAEALKGRNERLYARVMEEARWGLDYVLKVRFGDGYRSSYSSTSIWTDGEFSERPCRGHRSPHGAGYGSGFGGLCLADRHGRLWICRRGLGESAGWQAL